jgi:hypothetical protein
MKNIRFTSRRTDLKVLVILGLVGVTLVAAGMLQFWARQPHHISYDYLSSTKPTDADIIRYYWPHRLIQPEWVRRTPDWLENWSHAEATVRCLIVGAGWLIVSGGLLHGYTRLWKTPPNTALEPTATAP